MIEAMSMSAIITSHAGPKILAQFLMDAPQDKGGWKEDLYNAVGFPRVFYLKYHGYAKYFPLWALARYRNLKSGNRATTPYGM